MITEIDTPEILPLESWLNRDDPRFGKLVDAADAPTSLREWGSVSCQLTADALVTLLSNEGWVVTNATVFAAYDHRSVMFDLVDDGVLELSKNGWNVRVAEEQ